MACIRDDKELDELRAQHCFYKLQTGLKIFDGYTMPTVFGKYLDVIENFEVFDDDIWVTSVPKSGTTWTQEMVWCIGNDMDFERAKETQSKRFPYFEMPFILEGLDTAPLLKTLLEAKRPRFIKTHLPWNLLPRQIRTFEKRPKIIHVIRNPKDVCVSYYHYAKLISNYSGDFDLYWQLFIRDKIVYTPALKIMLTYWEKREEQNLLIIKYEDMKSDLQSAITKVASFMGRTLSEDDMQKLVDHISFESMRKNPATNQVAAVEFMHSMGARRVKGDWIRKGVAGGYKSDMTPEVIKIFDDWMATNLDGTGLSFD